VIYELRARIAAAAAHAATEYAVAMTAPALPTPALPTPPRRVLPYERPKADKESAGAERLLRRIEQAEHIGWPALAESFKRELQRVRTSTTEKDLTCP